MSDTDAKAATDRPALYLAGPDVFHEDAPVLGAQKKQICDDYGFEGLFPLDNEIGWAEGASPEQIAARIFDANIAMIRRSDGVIANITPFLGPTADDGTAFEIGYAAALGLPIALYDNGVGDTASKADAYRDASAYAQSAEITAEDFGLPVNLMLAVAGARDCPIATGEEPLAFTDLGRFEQAVQAMADRLKDRRSR